MIYIVRERLKLQDCSKLNWLPLYQWLSDENQLKNMWIGLLKSAVHLKNQEAVGNALMEVQRFVKLLDFFHYISSTA